MCIHFPHSSFVHFIHSSTGLPSMRLSSNSPKQAAHPLLEISPCWSPSVLSSKCFFLFCGQFSFSARRSSLSSAFRFLSASLNSAFHFSCSRSSDFFRLASFFSLSSAFLLFSSYLCSFFASLSFFAALLLLPLPVFSSAFLPSWQLLWNW